MDRDLALERNVNKFLGIFTDMELHFEGHILSALCKQLLSDNLAVTAVTEQLGEQLDSSVYFSLLESYLMIWNTILRCDQSDPFKSGNSPSEKCSSDYYQCKPKRKV